MSGEFKIGVTEGLSVRFLETEDGALSVLEIENSVHREVLNRVRSALLEIGIEVVSIEVRVDRERMLGRLHLTEGDGAPVDQSRHLQIQDRVFQVVLVDPEKARSESDQAKAAAS